MSDIGKLKLNGLINQAATNYVLARLKLPAIPYRRDLRFCSDKLRGISDC